MTEDFLIVTQEEGQFICYNSIDSDRNLNLNFEITIKKYDRKIDPLKIVYFSNVFDERQMNFDREIVDISYNKRFRASRFSINRATDFDKQYKFIISGYFEDLNIDTPKKVQIISKVWNRLNSSSQMRYYGEYFKIFMDFNTFIKSRLKDIKSQNKFYYLVVYSFVMDTYRLFSGNYSVNSKYDQKEFILKNPVPQNYKEMRTEKIIEELLIWMEDIYKTPPTLNGLKYEKEFNFFKKQFEFLNDYKNQSEKIEFEYLEEGSRNRLSESFVFNFHDPNYKFILKNLNLFENSGMFDIDWLGISSGHKAYLNVFSLLHFELKRVKTENLLLCIDEGDLYLHPKWQIEFFDKLINVIPKIYNGKTQLILTSHSPFLLSDLPKQNITIVSPNEDKSTINGNNLETETFAGNIYALYSEPFFLGNQRISLFAKKKIDGIITKIENKNLTSVSFSKVEIEREILLIGDEVIKFHLLKKLKND